MKNKLGEFVKEKRLDKAMNQEEFAKLIGITVPTLSKLENGGKVGSVVLRKLNIYTNVNTKLLREMMKDEN